MKHDMAAEKIQFDTSDYSPNNIMNMPRQNGKVLGLLKDEAAGEIITDYAGLRAKLYAYKVGGVLHTKAKGVKKSNMKEITFEDYLDALFKGKEKSQSIHVYVTKTSNVYRVSKQISSQW